VNDKPILYGPDGQPIRRETLTREIAGPTITGVRSPITGYPGDGLNPVRLANILREADAGNPLRYFELAEQIEERDLHYAGVLGTRKRSVAQLDIQVDAASDDPDDVRRADIVRDWLARDELQGEVFDMLDAIGKGVSFTETVWDTSEGQWMPARLEWRDARWFGFDRIDGKTPLLRVDAAAEGYAPSNLNPGFAELPWGKFVYAVIRAKSGLPIRSGIARLATWSWMFKAFNQRDWAIFAQTFGQPVRVGKYPSGASEKDKDTLFRAVANIAGDCAAIIPDSMVLDFIESKNVGAGSDLFLKRADHLDQQVSKAVLGQTATTDAVTGGLGSGKEHRLVQEDIERADAKALAAILNRDLIRPGVMLKEGPQKAYPRLRIGRPDDVDLKLLTESVVQLVPFGLRVGRSWLADQLGVPDAADDEEVLTAPARPDPIAPFGVPTLQSARPPAQRDAIGALARDAEKLLAPAEDELIDGIRAIVERVSSFAELQAELTKWKPALAQKNLAGLLRMALVAAELSGRAEIVDAAL
jgi:phage gp29-like protein